MDQILLAYGLPKETVTAIMMLNENTKVKVCSSETQTSLSLLLVFLSVHNLPGLRTLNVDRSSER